jgi:hypothetical protein
MADEPGALEVVGSNPTDPTIMYEFKLPNVCCKSFPIRIKKRVVDVSIMR